MKYNPLADKKFWIAFVDALTFLAIYFVGKYASIALDDLKTVFVTLQPLILIIITNMIVGDVQALNSGAEVPHLK